MWVHFHSLFYNVKKNYKKKKEKEMEEFQGKLFNKIDEIFYEMMERNISPIDFVASFKNNIPEYEWALINNMSDYDKNDFLSKRSEGVDKMINYAIEFCANHENSRVN
jgi:hypothetical protein